MDQIDETPPDLGHTPVVPEPWASVDDAAKHLGVTRDSVYRWIERKGMPAHRIGRLWKFKLTQVDAWVLAGGAAPEASGWPATTPSEVSRL